MDEELTAESPVDTVISIRKDLEEFQRISSKQELRAALREALKAAFLCGLLLGLELLSRSANKYDRDWSRPCLPILPQGIGEMLPVIREVDLHGPG